MNCQFLDSSTEFIFGESMNSLLDTPFDSQEFLDAFSQSLIGAGRRGNLAGGKLGFLFMFDKTWKQNYDKVHAFIDLAATDPEAKSSERSTDQPQRYILIDEMAKEIRDPITLRSEVLNIFFPAPIPRGIALSNTFFHLARNPGIWAELRAQALAHDSAPLTFGVLKSFSLFRYALFEGIRLQGPSGRIARTAVRDTVLPRGGGPDGSAPVFVPKGTIVALNNFPLFHDRASWGDDVEEFRPSRFVGKTYTWEFAPFLGGPRICPAQQQVITQAVYLLVRMAQEFETIENGDPCPEYVELIKMLCESRNGVKVALLPSKHVGKHGAA
jgi:cytochrome P450 monooxygenase